MWALHVTGGLTEADLHALLDARQRIRAGLGDHAPRRRTAPAVRCRAPAVSRGWRATIRRRWCGCSSRARCSACRSTALGRARRRSLAHERRCRRSESAADGVVRGRAGRSSWTCRARSTLAADTEAAAAVRLHRAAHRRRRHPGRAPRADRPPRPHRRTPSSQELALNGITRIVNKRVSRRHACPESHHVQITLAARCSPSSSRW